jgi:hypothetical protein
MNSRKVWRKEKSKETDCPKTQETYRMQMGVQNEKWEI